MKLEPSDKVLDIAKSFQKEGQQLLYSVSSENITPNSGTLAGQNKNWKVIFEDSSTTEQRLRNLEENFSKEKEKNAKMVELLSKSIIITVASEILLFSIGQQPRDFIPSGRFQAIQDDEGVKQFVDSIKSATDNDGFITISSIKTSEDFCKMADKIIDRRNNSVAHFSSIDDLDEKVEEVKGLFLLYDNLRTKFKNEWFIINSYEQLKSASFPGTSFINQ
ncbi:hypothetical protein HK103_003711 [Boothiomyces macroporosus]|uniref:Uncharacterized protein n=1 Tax=Boothiomyces macroporosus TaxID=261099 RepID=A0AAD5U8T7_9FUNG|nr:hypothetical protein HK103_003711 [Boothiomyces macroporosus]